MKTQPYIIVILLIVVIAASGVLCHAGGPYRHGFSKPALDRSLMGFKEQGVWYYLCSAPMQPHRIGPYYLQVMPPPVMCAQIPHGPGFLVPEHRPVGRARDHYGPHSIMESRQSRVKPNPSVMERRQIRPEPQPEFTDPAPAPPKRDPQELSNRTSRFNWGVTR